MRKTRPKHGAPWTVLIVPSCHRRVTNLRVPGWFFKMAAGATIAILAASTYLLVSNLRLRSEAEYCEELEVANRRQQQEILRLKQEAKIIRDKMQVVEELDKQLRKLLGLPPMKSTNSLEEEAGSMGGGIPSIDIPGAIETDESGMQGATVPGFDELNSLLERQAASLAELKTDVIARRQYLAALPTRWPARGIITSRFGYRQSPFGGGREFHDGLDIAAGTGAPIFAAGNGRVTFASWLAGYGRTVIIDHGYGYRTQYSHTSSILVRRGQKVKKGDLIARVGSTGRSTGPHLHFMISVKGKLVDPLGILP